MRPFRAAAALACAAVAGVILLAEGALAMAEPFAWRTASPASQGFTGAKLEAMRQELAARRTKAILVVRNDRIVLEWYAPGHGPQKPHYTASLAKALVGGAALMVALNDGGIGVDDPAWKYIPAWKDDPVRSKITIRQLATHTSGIADAEEDGKPHEKLTGWKGDFWKQRPDPFTISLRQAPVVFEPGSAYAYSNPGTAALAYCVTAALKDAPERDIRTLLKKRIMDPIGVPAQEWSIGYGTTHQVDGLPLVATWGGGSYTARAAACVGRLMLRRGDWDGTQLVDSKSVAKVTAYQDMPDPPRPAGQPNPGSGLCWWTNTDGIWAALPRDAFAGAGAGNQLLLVVPSLNLIVVRKGELLGDAKKNGFWGGVNKYVFQPLVEALTDAEGSTPETGTPPHEDRAPYQWSGLIAGVTWAPLDTVRRDAKGSDNWPMTWGDDDALYTAYGDGNGFAEPEAPRLSLGLAKVLGGPEDVRGVNIRSETAEQTGDGPSGKKASGMLMVDGVLYMLVRNAKNAQLAWSADRGQRWTWADWRFTTSFGCPTFLNFGKNYAGARDDYVYVYSFDSDTAYEPADRMVLARVPKGRIRERDAYEFFVRRGPDGQPAWSSDINARGAVFEHRGRCYRSGITYNPALKRYLWVQVIPGGDTRFAGGFGIYDAPDPWGPWTTAFFTEKWDMGPGETASFPTKWMSADGRTLHLVSSTTDYFTVRRATLTVRPGAQAARPYAVSLLTGTAMSAEPASKPVPTSRPTAEVRVMKVTRSPGNPLIAPNSGKRVGRNINGPSVIRVPPWIEKPLGKYYMYFAHHGGDHIRLAYANAVHGPWTVYEPGVLDLEDAKAFRGHIASPDVHVDEKAKRIRMYFHGPAKAGGGQKTCVAFSTDGLHFEPKETILGPFYFRVFEWKGMHYAIAKGGGEGDGIIMRSKDPAAPFEARRGIFVPGMRHAAVMFRGDTLLIFYSRIGDAPERIVLATVRLTDDWTDWTISEPVDVLAPEAPYEGIEYPNKPSRSGSGTGLRQLRDPAIFEEGGKVCLFYSIAGEEGIALAEVEGLAGGTD